MSLDKLNLSAKFKVRPSFEALFIVELKPVLNCTQRKFTK